MLELNILDSSKFHRKHLEQLRDQLNIERPVKLWETW